MNIPKFYCVTNIVIEYLFVFNAGQMVFFKIKCKKLRKLRLKFIPIRTIVYEHKRILIKHVFLLNFRHELLMSFNNFAS